MLYCLQKKSRSGQNKVRDFWKAMRHFLAWDGDWTRDFGASMRDLAFLAPWKKTLRNTRRKSYSMNVTLKSNVRARLNWSPWRPRFFIGDQEKNDGRHNGDQDFVRHWFRLCRNFYFSFISRLVCSKVYRILHTTICKFWYYIHF